MLRRLAVLLLVLALFGLMTYVLVKLTEQTGLMPDLGDIAANVEVEMAAKDVELHHGEEGRLIWRLRAQGASYDEEKGLVLVQAPSISYFTLPDNDELRVTATHGSVDQATSAVTLWPDVMARYEKSSLTAPEIVYDGNGLLTATGGVVVQQEGVMLRAPVVSYDLDESLFVAEGGVVLESGIAESPGDHQGRNAP